eukprot:GFUD01025088.1.p1 GENE.GFUD01025088.1~~GFUD01025088.1.p1  ORF type:complete len:251 (+),score=94.81 GFUD01025088.1:46-798(+)
MDDGNWQTGFDSAERLHRSVLAEVGDRARLARSSLAYNQASQRVRTMVGQLGSEVQRLRTGLANSSARLTNHELNRRRDLLDSLSRKYQAAKDQVSEPASGGAARGQLLQDLGTTSWGTAPSSDGFLGSGGSDRKVMPNRTGVMETDRSMGVGTGQVKQEQQQLLEQQDAGLDVLADIIRRQKGMGQDIFREVTQQNDLIDDIDDRAENVNQRLLDTTGSIRVVSRKDKTCGYWVVIMLLFIAIVVVLFA